MAKKGNFLLILIIFVLFSILLYNMSMESSNKEEFTTTPIDCIVSDWGPCSAICGMSGTTRKTILRSNEHGGLACPPASQLVKKCSKPPCTLESANFYNTVLGLYKYNPHLGNLTNI